MDYVYLLIIIIVPVILGLFLSFFLKNEKRISKFAPFLLFNILLLNITVLIYLSFGSQEEFISNANDFRIYSFPSIVVSIIIAALLTMNKVKLIFRIASYASISFFVGGILALMVTNFDSTDMALIIFIEVFFMTVIYWISLVIYRKINPNVKIATQINFSSKEISDSLRKIEQKLFGRRLNIKDPRYTTLKKHNEIEFVTQKNAGVRIIKYLVVILVITGYYYLAFLYLQ